MSAVFLASAAFAAVPRPFASDDDGVIVTPSAVTDADLDDSLRRLFEAAPQSDLAYEQLLILQAQVGGWVAEHATQVPGAGANLQAAIAAVIEGARSGFMSYFEAAFLREQVIEARLDVLLEQLIERARSTGWDPDLYESVVTQLRVRAAAAVGYPDPEAARVRLLAILERLRERAEFGAISLDAVRLELLRTRLMSYWEFLVRRARALGVTREQALPILEMVYQRARLLAQGA
ncbi:MAG: hypothetical protein R3F49_06020 [Planctomycetota bacterium]